MRFIEQPGGHVQVAEAPVWDKDHSSLKGRDHLLVALRRGKIESPLDRGTSYYLGQFYGCVCPGLIFTKFLFRGLKRYMMVEDDDDASKRKMAATWTQARDAQLVGNDPFNPLLRYMDAPPKRVFAVYISPNDALEAFPDIYGWAEHWTWIAADPVKAGAPVDWQTRYDKLLWEA